MAMADMFKVGELEFKCDIKTNNDSYSFDVFLTKPKLSKFSSTFTSVQLEDIVQHKYPPSEFLGILRVAFKQSNPRVKLSYSFVDDISNRNNLVFMNRPEIGNSLLLIINVKSEFADTFTSFILPLQYQKVEAEEMMSFMMAPQSDIQGTDNRMQVATLSLEIAELKNTLELLRGDISYWKNNANRISKLEENQNQLLVSKIQSDLANNTKNIQQLEKDVARSYGGLPQAVQVPVPVVVNHAPVIFAQVQNGVMSASSQFWQWNEVVSMPAGHFMLSTRNQPNDTLTVLQPGVYKVMVMAGSQSAANQYMDLYKNGTYVARVYSSSCGNYYHSYYIDNIYVCNVNDFFQVRHYYSSATLNSKPHNYFTILKLGTTQQY